MRKSFYTPEMISFLEIHIQGTSFRVLAEIFNTRFGCNKKWETIKSACCRRGMYNGVDTRRSIGSIPKNSFLPGDIPKNYRPVGSEHIDSYGFVSIKTADPDHWRLKHHVVWEQKNGALPKGSIVIFADGDKRNFTPDNLIALTRSEFCYLREHKLLSDDAETNKTAVLIAKVAIRAVQLQPRKNS